MKRPFFVVTLAILLAGLVLLGLSDTVISIADSSLSNSAVTSSEANNASASASIMITMTGAVDE